MEQTNRPVSRVKVVRTWLLLVGAIFFWLVFWVWHYQGRLPTEESAPDLAQFIFGLFVGIFFLGVGMVSYLIAVFTNCLTFDLSKPAWGRVKTKKYVANIFVTVLLGLGMGFVLSAFLTPVLILLGINSGLAIMLPVMGMVGLLQVIQLWVLMWTPLEKRFITSRLVAQGISDAQLQTGIPVGLSNPASGTLKRFGAIEEDMGELWVGPDQLVYRGDSEQLTITRDQLTRMERKEDTRSTTMLSGMAHVVLHIRQGDGSERLIRLHTEGLWTMGQKRRAMDRLADLIAKWHSGATPPPLPVS
jgi:hypothetical protein